MAKKKTTEQRVREALSNTLGGRGAVSYDYDSAAIRYNDYKRQLEEEEQLKQQAASKSLFTHELMNAARYAQNSVEVPSVQQTRSPMLNNQLQQARAGAVDFDKAFNDASNMKSNNEAKKARQEAIAKNNEIAFKLENNLPLESTMGKAQVPGKIYEDKLKNTMARDKYIENSYKPLQDKIDNGETLSTSETLTHAEGYLRNQYKEHEGLKDLTESYIDAYSQNTANTRSGGLTPSKAERENGKVVFETFNKIKDLTGWDDDQVKDYLMYANRLATKEAADISSKAREINYTDPTWKKIAKGTVNTAESIISSPVDGLVALGANFEKNPEGYGKNPYSNFRQLSNTTSAGVQNTAEALERDLGATASKAYQIGESIGESAFNMALTGAVMSGLGVAGSGAKAAELAKAGKEVPKAVKTAATIEKAVERASLIPFSANTYAETYGQARQRGLSEGKAQALSVIAGGAEALTEVWSLDHFWDMASGTKAGKNILVNWLAQAGIEGSEEVASSLINTASDLLISGDKSEYKQAIKSYMYDNNGNQLMTEDEAKQQARKDILSGILEDFVGGAISGGVMGAGGAAIGYANASQTQQNLDSVSKYFNNILMDQNYSQYTKEQAQTYANNPAQFFADNVNTETTEGQEAQANIQEYANRVEEGKNLSVSDKADIGQSLYVADTASQKYEQYAKEIESDPNEDIEKAYEVNKRRAENQLKYNSENVVQNTDTLKGARITSEGVLNSNGEKLSVEENSPEAKILLNARYEKNIEAQNKYVELANNEGTHIDSFNYVWKTFKNMGANETKFEDVLNTADGQKAVGEFGEDTLRAIYNVGVDERVTEAKSEASNTVRTAFGIKGAGKNGLAEASVRELKNAGYSEDEITTFNMFTKAMDINVVVDSNLKSQGAFMPSESVIMIHPEEARSFFHESLGEFVLEYNKEGHDALRKDLMAASIKVMGAQKYNAMTESYKRAYEKVEGNKSAVAVAQEMTNDIFVEIMGTEKGQKALAETLLEKYGEKEGKNKLNKITEFFDRFVEAIKNIASRGFKNAFQEAWSNDVETLESYAPRLMEAFDKAIQNRDNAFNAQNSAENVPSEVRNSQKVLSDGDKIFVNGIEGTVFNNTSMVKLSDGTELVLIANKTYSMKDINKRATAVQAAVRDMLKEHEGDQVHIKSDGKDVIIKPVNYIKVNGKTKKENGLSQEYTYAEAKKNKLSKKQKLVKMNSASSVIQMIEEAVHIAPGKNNNIVGHPNTINWDYYSTEFAIEESKNNYSLWSGKVNVMNNTDGKSYVYDITEMDEKANKKQNKSGNPSNGVKIPTSSVKNNITPSNTKVKNSLKIDSEGRELSEGQQNYFKDAKTRDEEGRLKPLYHGTGRADRVGYYFNPERATSGPMAFFTDNKNIAENYSKDKQDTSISRDERYDSYYTQFRMNIDGKDLSIGEAWNELPARKRTEIREKAPHITFDDDYENIIYDENKSNGLGNFDKYLLNEHKNNYLEALVDAWLEQGDLYNQEERFKEVMSLVGLDNVEYLDPYFRDEKVYETYLNITKPFNAVEAGEDFITDFESWWNNVDQDKYGLDMYSADMWDKSNMSIDSWIEKVKNDIENGTTHAWTVIPDAVTDYLKENGYDGIEDQGGKSGGEGHTVYIPFYSNQIKDVTNENPTNEDDIRYSLEIDDAFLDVFFNADENEYESNELFADSSSILEEGMEALKGQEVDSEAISKIATKLKNDFHSTIRHDTFKNQLEKVFAYMQTEDHVNYRDMMRILTEVARPVVDQSTVKVGEEAYNDFRNALKPYKIKLNDVQKQEVINTFGSYGNFTRAMMPITFSNEGTSLDSIWGEIVDATGGILDYSLSDADQPMALYDTLTSLRPSVENEYGGNIEDVSKDLAMRIVEEYLGSQSDAKSKELLKEMKQKTKDYEKQLRSEYQDRLDLVRKQMNDEKEVRAYEYKEEIARLKAKNKNQAQRSKERRDIRHERDMVAKQVKKLTKWIEKPTEEHHVPSEMVEPLLEFMHALDFVEPEVKQRKDGKWVVRVFNHSYEDSEGRLRQEYDTIEADSREEAIRRYKAAAGIGLGSENTRRWVDRMNLIKDLLNKAQNPDQPFKTSGMSNFIQNIDPAIASDFSEMLNRNRNELSVNNLSVSDFKILKRTLENITHAINIQNKAVAQKGEISEWAYSTMQRAKDIKIKDHTGTFNKLTKNLSLDMFTPETFFSFQGEGGKAIMKGLNSGFDKKVSDIKKTKEYMEDVLKDVSDKDFKNWRGKHAEVQTFTVFGGDQITLTKAQIMSLYELNKRDQAVLHYKGGVKADEITIRGKQHIQNKVVHFANFDVAKIIGTLTEKEKAVADKMQQFMANECSKWGNEASMAMYGYEKFLDKNYFPISTDKQSNATTNSNASIESLNGIERSGFTKNINEFADNAIMIKDIFDVFEKHVEDVAAYHGYAPAIKDAIRWMNYKVTDEIDKENSLKMTDTVKRALSNNLGRADSAAEEYLKNLLMDINGKETSRELRAEALEKFIGNYKAQAIGGNLRVVIQQPTAYFRAMNVIDPKYLLAPSTLAKAAPGVANVNIKRIKEISPMVWWKSQGYYETSLGKSMDEMITGQSTVRDKLTEASMTLAGWADDITWSALYTAVEKEVKATTANLTEEEYRKRVNERFNDVITQTQVVDSVLQKSQWMRTKSKWASLNTAFMAEPTKSYNMAVKAIMQDYQKNGGNVFKWKSARKALAVLLVTDVVNSAAQALIDAVRYHDDDDKYLETWVNYFKKDLIDNINPLSRIPVVKNMADKLVSTLSGETRNTSSTLDDAALSSVVTALLTFSKRHISHDYNKTDYAAYMDYARAVSTLTGVPVYNVSRELASFYNLLPGEDLVRSVETNIYKKALTKAENGKDSEAIQESLNKALEKGGTVGEYISKVNNKFKSDYIEAYGTPEEAGIHDKALNGFMAAGLSEEDAEAKIAGWLEEDDDKTSYNDLYKAIESPEADLNETLTSIMDEKDKNEIAQKLVKKYSSTIEYNRENGIENKDIENRVNEALDTLDTNYEDELVKYQKIESRPVYKNQMYSSIENGDGDYTKSVDALLDSGMEYSDIKSNITNEYKSEIIRMYKKGSKEEKSQATKMMSRIANVKAYCDKKGGMEEKKEGFYDYELKIVQKWLEEK